MGARNRQFVRRSRWRPAVRRLSETCPRERGGGRPATIGDGAPSADESQPVSTRDRGRRMIEKS